MSKYKPGVLFGEELQALYNDAKQNGFALPAVNTTGTDTINAALEAAAKVNSPIIIQFSNGGAQFIAGKGMPNDKLQANISGGVSGAVHIHTIANYSGVPVVIHTDHAAKKWLPWVSGLLDAGEQFFKEKGQPLFSSHMLDLSEEPIKENVETSVQFYKRMAPLGMSIEIELGVTGGEDARPGDLGGDGRAAAHPADRRLRGRLPRQRIRSAPPFSGNSWRLAAGRR